MSGGGGGGRGDVAITLINHAELIGEKLFYALKEAWNGLQWGFQI